MKIAIASDHAGFNYKEKIKKYLLNQGHNVQDFGTDSADSCDYPDFIRPAAMAVAAGKFEHAIVLDGSGHGEAMVTNKISGIQCALCWNIRSARLSREHNNTNVLSLGQRTMSIQKAMEILELWLNTPFEGGHHQRRIDKIEK